MIELTQKFGDLFEEIKSVGRDADNWVVVPHVCNDVGAFGAGFAGRLASEWPKAKYSYMKSMNGLSYKDRLGLTQLVQIMPYLHVANMVAQRGLRSKDNPIPLRMSHLTFCMKEVHNWILREKFYYGNEHRVERAKTRDRNLNIEIHCPTFGSGLAGGNWEFIKTLIEEIWCDNDIKVVVYNNR
jgi:hypothetical protein